MVIHNTFADFVLFLYIHMAHADGGFDISERKIIQDKMSKLYPDGNDYDHKIDATVKEYLSHSKIAVSDIIKNTFRHFNSVKFALKYKVYTDMFDIIHADGKVDESETAALDELKRIIDLSVEK